MVTKVEQSDNLRITTRKVTRLDQLVQILEISFIFLLTFSIIALLDAVSDQFDLYGGISGWLGEPGVGSLDGGNWEQIVRITLIFNLLLFSFSLFFGLWIRRTRDGWTWKQLGYTLNPDNYNFRELMRRGTLLGLVAIVIFYLGRGLVMILTPNFSFVHAFAYWTGPDTLYTPKELQAEYYFGIVEMGFIWPLSAGFFFFAYAHNSLNAKFPTGIANVLSTFFYVFYLQFFFLIPSPDKINQLTLRITQPVQYYEFWIMSLVLWIILYINFSAFAETRSIALPFIMNFIFNVGITMLQAINTLIFTRLNILMLILYIIVIMLVIGWYYFKSEDFSTIRIGFDQLKDFTKIRLRDLAGFVLIFVLLSFFIPGWINEILYFSEQGRFSLQLWVIPTLYAINFVVLVFLAVLVLTYEPTEVWDVLLVSQNGTPVASYIELFETDEVLISGFFTALAAVDKELSEDKGLKSVKRGQREILIEEGVFTRLIALVDRDQESIRQRMSEMHRQFEVEEGSAIEKNSRTPDEYVKAQQFVKEVADLELRFAIPQQTKWIGTISVALAPLMIFLIGIF